MHLTPPILHGAYEFLRLTPPFKGWRMPVGDSVEFHVTDSKRLSGCYTLNPTDKCDHRICISQRHCKHTDQLLITMMHEMVHLREFTTGQRKPESPHGPKFKKLAEQVCKQHGIKPQTF